MGPPLFIVMKGVDYLDVNSLGAAGEQDVFSSIDPLTAASPGPSSRTPELDESIDIARGMRELVQSIEADPYVDGPVFGWYEEFTNAWLPFNDVLMVQGAERTGGCDVGSATVVSSSWADNDGNINNSSECDRLHQVRKRKIALCNALRSFLTDSAEGEPFKHDVVLRFDHGSDALIQTNLSSSTPALSFMKRSSSPSVSYYEEEANSPPCAVAIARLRT